MGISGNNDLEDRINELKSEAALKAIGEVLLERQNEEFEKMYFADLQSEHKISAEAESSIRALINQEKRKQKHQQRKQAIIRATRICAVIILSFLVLSSMLFVSDVEAFKWKFRNFFVDRSHEYTQLTPGDDEPDHTAPTNLWYPSYLPEQYELESYDIIGTNKVLFFHDKKENKQLELIQLEAGEMTVYLDNEDVNQGNVQINEDSFGHWVQDSGETVLAWMDHDMFFQITGEIELEQLMLIADSLIWR